MEGGCRQSDCEDNGIIVGFKEKSALSEIVIYNRSLLFMCNIFSQMLFSKLGIFLSVPDIRKLCSAQTNEVTAGLLRSYSPYEVLTELGSFLRSVDEV